MKSSDIEPNEHYAAHLNGTNYEIAEVRVRAMGAIPGTVDVEVIHPEGEADDERYDVRTVETKKLLGPWNAYPEPLTRQGDYVVEGKTFAEHAADEFARVQSYNETAARLSEVGIPREQITWLPRKGHGWGGYDPRKVGTVELSHDEIAQLLFLAGNRRSTGQEQPDGYLVTDFCPRMDGYVAPEDATSTVFGPNQRELADAYATTPHHSRSYNGPLRVYRVVRDA